MNTTDLEPRLQKLIDLGESGTDILHGELKNLMYEAEQQFLLATVEEEYTGAAIDSMERRYWEGMQDAYAHVYGLTYQLAFAISDRKNKNA